MNDVQEQSQQQTQKSSDLEKLVAARDRTITTLTNTVKIKEQRLITMTKTGDKHKIDLEKCESALKLQNAQCLKTVDALQEMRVKMATESNNSQKIQRKMKAKIKENKSTIVDLKQTLVEKSHISRR